jgi:chromosome segregation ATPase
MTRQVDRVTQIERITNDRVAQVQSNIKEAESKLDQLNTVLTIMTYKIEEADVVLTTLSHQREEADVVLTTLSHQIEVSKATIEEADEVTNAINTSIQEVDGATIAMIAMIDCKDAEDVSRAEFIQRADEFKTAYEKDAKAISTGIKKAKQTLINTKDKMMIELASKAPNTTGIELTKQAIEKEYQKAIAEVRAEKDRNMKNINDKSRSVQDEILKLTRTTRD